MISFVFLTNIWLGCCYFCRKDNQYFYQPLSSDARLQDRRVLPTTDSCSNTWLREIYIAIMFRHCVSSLEDSASWTHLNLSRRRCISLSFRFLVNHPKGVLHHFSGHWALPATSLNQWVNAFFKFNLRQQDELWVPTLRQNLCWPHSSNNGISLNSFKEHKYSPTRIITIVPSMCTIHQSSFTGIPEYQMHEKRWMRNRVTEKSKHFFDFSTIIANSTALCIEGWCTLVADSETRRHLWKFWMSVKWFRLTQIGMTAGLQSYRSNRSTSTPPSNCP